MCKWGSEVSLGQSKFAKGMVRCSLWPIMACQREGEVEGINERSVWNVERWKKIGILENGNLVACGGRKE